MVNYPATTIPLQCSNRTVFVFYQHFLFLTVYTGRAPLSTYSRVPIIEVCSLSVGLEPCETRINLRFFSKVSQNTVRRFQASFQRVLGLLVTWWCFTNFVVVFRAFLKTFRNSLSTTKSSAALKLFGNLLEITWQCFD